MEAEPQITEDLGLHPEQKRWLLFLFPWNVTLSVTVNRFTFSLLHARPFLFSGQASISHVDLTLSGG